MRIIFAGTPEFAAAHLQAILTARQTAGFEVVAVYTQPDRPAGRGKQLQASAVKQLAQQHNLPVEQPLSLKNSAAQAQLASYNADLMVVVAYGLILPQAVLDLPRLGCVNVHGSLLPRWRGAAPIQRALWAGDTETGVAIMQMAAGLDTGPVLLAKSLAISSTDTSASLYEKLAQLGPAALLEALSQLPELQAQALPQDNDLATYAHKLDKAEAALNWQQPAVVLERHIRAFNPWPVSWFEYQPPDASAPVVIKVWQAEVVATANAKPAGTILSADKAGICIQTATDALRLTLLQAPGKRAMSAADFLNARQQWFRAGDVLPTTALAND